MRTNIDIDDAVLDAAMKAGPFKTKKDAVEAGLKLLARQAHYREILRWEGKLKWEGDDEASAPPAPLSTADGAHPAALSVQEPTPGTAAKRRHAGR